MMGEGTRRMITIASWISSLLLGLGCGFFWTKDLFPGPARERERERELRACRIHVAGS